MFPSSIWMAIVGPAGVVLEDRVAVAHAVPKCRARQLSFVTSSRVDANGSFTVSWTRPLAPPRSSGQPSITPGNVSLIGAFYAGSALDLRPCEPTGIPIHEVAAAFTVQLLGAGSGAQARAREEEEGHAPTRAPTAAAGLVATLPVCIDPTTGGSRTALAALSADGLEHFYGDAGAVTLLAGATVLDPAGRALYSLAMGATGAAFDLVSLDVDTGAAGAACTTSIPVPTAGELDNVNLAWDAGTSSVIVAACTDAVCAGYVQVSRVAPRSCATTPVVKVPTDPTSAPVQGASAYDASSGLFVMSITQAVGGGAPGLVLVVVDMASGAVRHVFNEAGRGRTLVALVSGGPGAPPGAFWGLDAPDGAAVALVTYDAVRNTLTRAPAIAGADTGALQGLAALGGEVLYFLAPGGGGATSTRLFGVFTANGTLASAGTLPGDAPTALAFV